ncbi:MAG: hypothetical protein Q4F11_02305 [Eubacteriales bacterium]|nr:hypothetical protein [Eubacteriales bacterium]
MNDFGLVQGLNSAYNNNYVSQTGNNLENSLNNSDLSTATDDELMEVCKDFEKYFVEQVMKSMQKMADVDGDGQGSSSLFSTMAGISSSDAGMSTLSSYFGDQYISSLSETLCESQDGQGLGIAQMLYQQMKRNYSIDEAL